MLTICYTLRTMSFGKRIYLARKARKLTQTGIARALGISPQSVQQWEKDESMPRRQRMADLAELLHVNIGYLEHGMGLIPSHADLGPTSQSTQSNVEPVIGTQNGKVPLISWVQAGAWDEAIDNLYPGDAETWLPCPVSHGSRTFALRVKGDSMTASYGKSYPEGSVIYIDPDQAGAVTTGDRVIAKMLGENAVTFKSFIEDAGKYYLKPLNPAYPLIIDPFQLLGKVILKMEFE